MSSDLLRLILFILGIALVLGIYFWERNKRLNASVHAIRREPELDQEPVIASGPGLSSGEAEPEALAPEETESLAAEPELKADDAFIIEPEPKADEAAAISQELGRLDELIAEEQTARGEQIPLFAEESEDESAVAPDECMLVQINIKARKDAFGGEAILEAAQAMGMIHGEMQIFHRYSQPNAKARPCYSMASMVEPGFFPVDAMAEFSTPGLLLFLQLPGREQDLNLFKDMLRVADGIAKRLGGELQDETHSTLTRQAIEHLREQIVEHQRQRQLARKKQ